MCVHIPMCASYLSNIMFNYFKVTVLIETACIWWSVFPRGRITKAKEVWFFLLVWFFCIITFILCLIGSLGVTNIAPVERKWKPGSLKKSRHY